MITGELVECLKEMRKKHDMQYGVIPCNQLDALQIVRYPLCLSFLIKHWTVFYKKTQYSELEGFCRYVLDSHLKILNNFEYSLGTPLHEYGKSFTEFIKKHGVYSQNTSAFQGMFSDECGKFCLMYIYCRLQGIPRQKIYAKFSNDLKRNDAIVNRFFKRHIVNSILRKKLKHLFVQK